MKRFLTTFCIFVFGLVVLAGGFNVALDHAGSSTTLTSVTVINEQGTVVFAYSGDIETYRASVKSNSTPGLRFLHRT